MKNVVLFAQQMIKLLKEFGMQQRTTPNEFIDNKLRDGSDSEKSEELYENFLTLMKHEEFFNLMVHNFWCYYGLKHFNKEIITTLTYVIIFKLDGNNCAQVIEMLITLNYRFCFNVIEYFTVEDNLVDVVQAACKYFESDYVLEHILHPIVDKQNIIEKVYFEVGKETRKRAKIVSKPLTIPVAPACLKNKHRLPPAPLNSSVETQIFKSSAIPKVVLKGDNVVRERLKEAHSRNRKKAIRLLDIAQRKAFKCANILKKTPVSETVKMSTIKPKKVPFRKEVIIKKNTAALMREAATFVKHKENEIKKIEILSQAVFDPTYLETLEKDIQKCKEQEHLQDIERKHLQGQLTYEESILAKQKLLKSNQQKMEEFKQERINILEEIDKWRQAEQEKIKILVERSQNIEKAAKDAGKRMQQFKKVQARMVDNETKDLLKEAFIKKQEELACKVKLIQELRALHQVRCLEVKEFDPTETPNFGLFCEMSIAELQERLGLLKLELHEELVQRRKTIAESRQKQQQLIESVKEFIGQSRVSKPKPVPRSACKLEQTPEIIALRERLQQARHTRMGTQQPSVHC